MIRIFFLKITSVSWHEAEVAINWAVRTRIYNTLANPMDKHNTLYTAQNKYTQADPKSLKYIKNNCISMSISLSVSARDTDIGGRPKVRGLILTFMNWIWWMTSLITRTRTKKRVCEQNSKSLAYTFLFSYLKLKLSDSK